MAKEEHDFVVACGELARLMGVSLAAARRRVDQAAAAAGRCDRAGRLVMAYSMLERERESEPRGPLLDALLGNTEEDDAFMAFMLEDE